MRLYLADDDEMMRELLAAVVKAQGHTATGFPDGGSIWAAFEREPVPMVLLDWHMPGLDGLEVCRRIRAHASGEETFILVVTAASGIRNLDTVLDAGADDYLSKPVTPEDLTARLRIAEKRIEVNAARRKAEEALRKARYLAGVGELSLALQHEINNPLAALLTNSALITSGMLTPEEAKASLAAVDAQARRVADVVKRLNTLSDPSSVEYAHGRRMVDLAPGPQAK